MNVSFNVHGTPVTLCVDDGATDSISLAVKRRDSSIFIEFADIAPYIPPGSTVLDVGAHIGVASLYFLSRGHAVVSFEAAPENLAQLEAARAANGFTNWTIVHAAVSDRPGTVSFAASGPHGHITPDGAAEATVTARAVDLDSWLAEHPQPAPIGLVKLDIEGAELLAIAGAKHLLSAADAPAVFIESNGNCLSWFGETPVTLRSALESLGYHNLGIRSKRLLRPTSFYPVPSDALQGLCCVNYFCVKDLAQLRARGARVDTHGVGRAQVLREVTKMQNSSDPTERAYIERTLPLYPDVESALHT